MRRLLSCAFAGACLSLAIPTSAAGPLHSRPVEPRATLPDTSRPVLAAAPAQAAGSAAEGAEPATCGEVPGYISPRYYSYMQTVMSLDCIAELANDRLNGAAGETLVPVPREELQRIVTLAREAKHAAALID